MSVLISLLSVCATRVIVPSGCELRSRHGGHGYAIKVSNLAKCHSWGFRGSLVPMRLILSSIL